MDAGAVAGKRRREDDLAAVEPQALAFSASSFAPPPPTVNVSPWELRFMAILDRQEGCLQATADPVAMVDVLAAAQVGLCTSVDLAKYPGLKDTPRLTHTVFLRSLQTMSYASKYLHRPLRPL